MDAFNAHVDAHAAGYVRELAEACAIVSVSSDPARRPDTIRMMHVVAEKIIAMGGTATLNPNPLGRQAQPDGSSLDLPPILTGAYPATPVPNLKTILM